MKNISAIGIVLSLIACLFSSCKRDDIRSGFQGDPKLFLRIAEDKNDVHNALFIEKDSANYRFSYKPANILADTVNLVVQLMGNVADHDRVFKLEVDPTQSTAQPDEYIFPIDMVLPAGKFSVSVPVVIRRADRLKDTETYLTFKLVSTSDFQINQEQSSTEGEWTSCRLFWSDILPRPAWWIAVLSAPSLGKYSRVKHNFMLDELEISPARLDTVYVANQAGQIIQVKDSELANTLTRSAFVLNPKLDLYKQNNQGDPLLNEFGEEIRFCGTCN